MSTIQIKTGFFVLVLLLEVVFFAVNATRVEAICIFGWGGTCAPTARTTTPTSPVNDARNAGSAAQNDANEGNTNTDADAIREAGDGAPGTPTGPAIAPTPTPSNTTVDPASEPNTRPTTNTQTTQNLTPAYPNTSVGNSNGSLGYVPLAPLTGDRTSAINPEQYLPSMFDLLIGVSALLAIVMIVIGGITYMTSDVFSQKSHGKETITNALWGLLLVISAYMILYTVNPDLLKFRLSFPLINNPGWQAPVGGTGSNWFVTPACREAGNCGVLPRSGGGRGDSVCAEGNSACSPEAIESAGLPWEQAVTMSCIAMTENSGSPVGCSGTGPCGTFQISQENWRAYAPSDCAGLSNQNNADCNLRTAVTMVRRLGYQPWTGNNNGVAWNTAASACVNNYDAGTSLRR